MPKILQNEFVEARPHARLTPALVIQMLRELKGWTRAQLARRSGMSSTEIARLELGNSELTRAEALALAGAFDIHPATIMFPEYEDAAFLKAA